MSFVFRRVLPALLLLLLLALGLALPRFLAFRDGLIAYLYAYPLVTMDLTRQLMTVPEGTDTAQQPSYHLAAPINRFAHAPRFPDHTFTDVVAPNADTLYSIAWLDLSREPVVLHTPEMGRRWMLMELVDGWTNAFASLGTRVYGHEPRDYLIAGPRWNGRLPAGLNLVRSPTDMVWVIGRTYTVGADDFAEVHALQNAYALAPLSAFAHTPAPVAGRAPATPAPDLKTAAVTQVARLDTMEYFGRLARLMAESPPAPADAPVLAVLARLGIAPGQPFRPERLSERQRQGLEEAARFAKIVFHLRAPGTQGAIDVAPWQEKILGRMLAWVGERQMPARNGWMIPKEIGQYGSNYVLRAFVTLVGLGANVPEDVMYPATTQDADGQTLSGARRYVLHFAKDAFPPVRDAWSLTMYNDKARFTDNPIGRYALGSRDALKRNSDGSLDIFLQHDAPEESKRANWLPAPAGGFRLMLRLYGPDRRVLDGSWIPPAVRRVAE